jgi:hypothetical protein
MISLPVSLKTIRLMVCPSVISHFCRALGAKNQIHHFQFITQSIKTILRIDSFKTCSIYDEPHLSMI